MNMITGNSISFLLLVFVLTNSESLTAQTTEAHQRTTTPENARYEIVQSELAARWTFRLNRYTGQVSQIVKTENGEYEWQEMEVENLLTISNPTSPRFQIFSSGLAARYTFLIDTDTGKTWQLTTVTNKSPDGKEYEYTLWALIHQ